MRIPIALIGCALIIASGAGIFAEQRGTVRLLPAPKPAVKFVGPWRTEGSSGVTKVIGTVIDFREVAVAKVKVQLRNLTTGAVLAQTTTNDLGEYEFVLAEPGTFVVEMVLADGFVVALSNAGSLARFETLNTVIRLSGRWDVDSRNVIAVNNPTEFLGMSSATTITSTTIVIATDQGVPTVNPGEPVSPR